MTDDATDCHCRDDANGRTTFGARALAVPEMSKHSSFSDTMPAFKAVYVQYFEFVWMSARRLGVDAAAMDDVVQEVFIVIHSKLHTLERPEALRSWIYGIVRRTVSTHRRSKRSHDAGIVSDSVEVASDQPTPLQATGASPYGAAATERTLS